MKFRNVPCESGGDKIRQTSDHTYKQKREFEIAIVVTPAISFQFAHLRSDEGQTKKYQHIATQNVRSFVGWV